MSQNTEVERKTLNELCQDFTATQILYLLGETLLLEIDEKAEIQYVEGEEPHSFMFKMENGRVLSVLVMDVIPNAKRG